MKPFFTYYGGKWRAADKYPSPIHDTVIEPFAGSAGYSVRHNARRVLLADLNEKVIGTWEYLIRASAKEIRSLPDVPDGATVNDLQVCQEARWLIGWWLNKGSAQPCNVPSAWMRSMVRPSSFWGAAIRERVASQVEGIRHWEARLCDYRELPVDGHATWFVDPPYANAAGRVYRHSDIEYSDLGEWCRTLAGQVIVCENLGADWLPFTTGFDVRNSPGKQKTSPVSKEVYWLSSA